MPTAKLVKAGRYYVDQIPCPHPSGLTSGPPKCILHTTEGGWGSALSVFRTHYAPHFLVGQDRIAQLVPVGYMAAALENHAGGVETNSISLIQVEIVGYSKKTPWLPDPKTYSALVALLGALHNIYGIPLIHTPNPKRDPRLWVKSAGLLGHADVPENSHWDPGALDYVTLIRDVKASLQPPKPEPVPNVADFWKWAAWKDAGADPKTRPPVTWQIPLSWQARYLLHTGGKSGVTPALRAYLLKNLPL